MTPYLTMVAIEALKDRTTILAWRVAAYSRMKRLPKLESLLSAEPPSKEEVADKMKNVLLQHNQRRSE